MTHTIGEAIEGRLHEMRIQQKELAAVIDVPVSTLNSWLRLGRDIPAQYILKIAHVLRCTPTYLLSGGEDDRETPAKSDAIEDLIRAMFYRMGAELLGDEITATPAQSPASTQAHTPVQTCLRPAALRREAAPSQRPGICSRHNRRQLQRLGAHRKNRNP